MEYSDGLYIDLSKDIKELPDISLLSFYTKLHDIFLETNFVSKLIL